MLAHPARDVTAGTCARDVLRAGCRSLRSVVTTIDGLDDLVLRALGGRPPTSVVPLGEGQENVAVLVDGVLVVRVARDPSTVGGEVALLSLVRPRLPVAAPEVVWSDAAAGALAYRVLDGTPLLGRPVGDARAVGAVLGASIAAVAAVPLALVEDLVPRDAQPLREWRSDAAALYAEVRGELAPHERSLVERFLTEPLPRAPLQLVLCHNDLGAEHVIADGAGERVTGIIDWTDAAIGDLAHDIGLVWRDLGDLVTVHLVGALGRAWTSDDAARATFYARAALLEDLAHGLAHDAPRYVDNARANLARVFS